MSAQAKIDYERLDDAKLARLVASRDTAAVRLVTMRNNQRLFRAAWSILKDRSEAEDAVQTAYLKAFAAIGEFEGRSSLSTWLTRIAINEALMRRRAAKRRRAQLEEASVSILDDYREQLMRGSMSGSAPDADVVRAQIRSLLESAVGQLPEEFRPVFVLREIEGLSI
ncbi:MAG TPA: sigma-70 family RNA polymerase sigma factor, partial [Sphingomicrobium sp.]